MARSRWAVVCVALASPWVAQAQAYPARALRVMVPFPAGGTADLMPRIVAERLSARRGRSVVIDDCAGTAGNIGAEMVYKAEPDGYTLLSAPPPLVINPSLYANLAFDPTRCVPVSVMGAVPHVLLVNPKVAAHSARELIAWAKAQPQCEAIFRKADTTQRCDVVGSANVRID